MLLAALLGVSQGVLGTTYYYRGEKNSWGATAMITSSDGYYSYYSTSGTHQFKISTSTTSWDYNYTYVSAGFNSTDVTNIGDYGSDNCYCWQSGSYYILVYYPNTDINSTNKPIICASTTLPDNSCTTPTLSLFNVSGSFEQLLSDGVSAISVASKSQATYDPTITVRYNGNTNLPNATGTYPVTIDVTAAGDYCAETGISVGTLTVGNNLIKVKYENSGNPNWGTPDLYWWNNDGNSGWDNNLVMQYDGSEWYVKAINGTPTEVIFRNSGHSEQTADGEYVSGKCYRINTATTGNNPARHTISAINCGACATVCDNSEESFTTIMAGATEDKTFTFDYGAGISITTVSVEITGTDRAQFNVKSVSTSGNVATVVVTHQPTSAGDHSASISIPYTGSSSGTHTKSISAEAKTYYIKGTMNSWGDGNPMTSSDGTSYECTFENLEKNTGDGKYEFKLYNSKEDTWAGYGTDQSRANITRANNSISGITFNSGANINLKADHTGDYKFTYSTASGGSLTVTYPTLYTITGAVNGSTGGTISPSSVQASAGETVRFTATPSSGYSVVKWNDGSDHVTTATTFDYTVGKSAQTVTVYFQCNEPSVTPGYETITAQTICVGETALSLSVTESGYVSSRKWQRKGTGQGDDWTDISNSSSTTYNVPNDAASSYYYRYVAVGCSTTYSTPSSLYTVNVLPESVSINEVTACSGVGFNLTLSRDLASGESAAWYKNVNGDWTSLTSATGVVQSAETDYKVIITNSNDCTVEATRTVGMIQPNSLTGISLDVSYICNGVTTTVRPSDLYLSEGATLSYSSSATGTATVSKNQDNTATVTGGAATGSATITASISGGCGSVASQTATINVVAAPTVLELTNPSGKYTMCSDGSITLKIASTQSGYTYQLYQNGVKFGDPVSGGGDKTFEVNLSGIYTAKAYYGSSESSCLTDMDGTITLNISTTPNLVRSTPEVTNYSPVTITSINSDIYKWQVKDDTDTVVCDTDPDNPIPGTTAYLYDQTATSITFKGASGGSVYKIIATTKGGCSSDPAEIEVNIDTPCN